MREMRVFKTKGPVSALIFLLLSFLVLLILAGCSTPGRSPSGGEPLGENRTKEKSSESASTEWGEVSSGSKSKGDVAGSKGEVTEGAKIATTEGDEDSQAYLNGAGLAELKCTLCHESGRWKGLKRDKNWWNAKVDKMMRLGASKWITAGQAREIVDYLAVDFDASAVKAGAGGKAKQVAGETKPAATPVAQETAVAGTSAVTITAGETTGSAAASAPERQAYTGAEVWLYILGGGSMLAVGLKMRRRERGC